MKNMQIFYLFWMSVMMFFKSRQAICNDMRFGDNITNALSNIEVFSHIPQDMKFELFLSTIGSCDIFKRYCE